MVDISKVYLSQISPEHRQQFGQFFTPEVVAKFMVSCVLENGGKELYDPAFGLGAFYFAAKAINSTISFTASEIDPVIINFWDKHVKTSEVSIFREDYLQTWGRRYNAIVCNPPYMRFQKFFNRDQVFKEFLTRIGLRLSGYTNIASAFLVKSISELNSGGRLAYIMPLEFLNTGYGEIIKRYLITQGWLRTIIRLECEKAIFPDVTTTIGIILFEKSIQRGKTKFYTVRNLEELPDLLAHPPEVETDLLPAHVQKRWLNYFEPQIPQEIHLRNFVPLLTYGNFSRGIATGANNFFVLTPQDIKAANLSNSEVVPCISKSSQVRTAVFTASDLNELISRNAPVFLLNVNRNPSHQAMLYIKQGEIQKIHHRYLTRVRTPWYRIESRSPAPIWFGVFSRNGYKVVRNYSNALHLTCFHGFYPNLFGAQFIDHIFLYLISNIGRKIVRMNIRKYGDSLDKFEPNDLNNALAPSSECFLTVPLEEISQEIENLKISHTLSAKMETLFESLFWKSQKEKSFRLKV